MEREDKKLKQERERAEAEFKQKLELSLKLAEEQKRSALLELKLKEQLHSKTTPSLPARDVADIFIDVGNVADTHTAPTLNMRAEQSKVEAVVVEEEVSITPVDDVVVLRRSQVSIPNTVVNSQANSPVRDASTARPDVSLRQTETIKLTPGPTASTNSPIHTTTTNLAVGVLQPCLLYTSPSPRDS